MKKKHNKISGEVRLEYRGEVVSVKQYDGRGRKGIDRSDRRKLISKWMSLKTTEEKYIIFNPNIMNCGKTNLPYGTRVRVVNNFGNECEPFLDKVGTAVHPFNKGCVEPDWVGVIFDEMTMYGKNFNFHIDELYIEPSI